MKEHHLELEKSQDGTVSLVEYPKIRSYAMSRLRFGANWDGISIDRAATKITLDDDSIDSFVLSSGGNYVHIYAGALILDLK